MFSRGRKKWIGCLVTVLLLGAGTVAVLYVHRNYTVENVYVEGNVHYTQEEIKEMVMGGTFGDNSLYLSWKYKDKSVVGIPFVDVMDVSILAPDTIKITVYEKALAGYVEFMGTNMYFDKDGYVVENSSVKTQGVPQITGLTFDYAVLGQALPVEDPGIFARILDLSKLLNKYSLQARRIHFRKDGEIFLFFDDVKVALGEDELHIEDKIMLLPEFLPSLMGKKGTLKMEKYDETNGKYTFLPEQE